jgi:hypothetical protein
MSMVMTHLAGVADRIDRPNAPRGGGEERELVNFSKEHASVLLRFELL